MNITKKNGTVLKKSSKKQTIKKTLPLIRLGLKTKRKRKIVYLAEIRYNEEKECLTEKVKNIVLSPVPAYKSRGYLTKNTVVETETGKNIKITCLDKKCMFMFGLKVK